MNHFRITLLLVALIIALQAYSQTEPQRRSRTADDKKVVKEVEEVNRKTREVNETVVGTGEAIEKSVEETKNTVDKVGDILFGNSPKNKSKRSVTITIPGVAYDEPMLEALYQNITRSWGDKKTTKTFQDQKVVIQVSCKQSADDVWSQVPTELRKNFTVQQMSEQTVQLELASQE